MFAVFLGHGIAEVCKNGAVTREGCGVARNVNHTLRVHFHNRFYQCLVTALSWRVNYYHVGLDAFFFKLCRRFGRVTADEACIGDAVFFCVFLCILYSIGYDFNADKLFYFLCHSQADCAHTAVHIEKHCVFIKLGIFCGKRIKPFGLRTVDLIKRER